MTVKRARSIDDLYAEVAGYDLVLTTDAPLSLALNRRLDSPRLGRFAATPQMLASGGFRPHDRRQLFFELIEHTDLSWKHATYLLEHALECWGETGRLDAILEYDRFDTEATREVLAVIEGSESAHSELAEYTIPESSSVAVIGIEQFTALDRSILPAEYDVVDPLSESSFDLPPFRIFDSATAIVETLVENVTPANAADVAVVMDRGGDYPALVESAFGANDVPFHGGPGFADDENVRTCLRLLRAAHAGGNLRVADVRPILSRIGVACPVEEDNKRLHELDDPDLERVQEFCETLGQRTFADALSEFEAWGECALDSFREELERLGRLDSRVTEAALDEVEFYLQSFDIPVDREDSGVLLADATAAAYVDRPIVFYLGLDADWTHRIPDRPWIDAETKDRQHLEQFQVLLQNGVEQYYLVQETAAGKPVTPCLYFHDLLDEPFETFADFPHRRHTRFRRGENVGFERESINVDPTPAETISQSSLNRFVNCPRDYLFGRLVETPGRDYFRKGNLFHDFAEFYVNHPGFVEDREFEAFVDLMLAEMRPYVDDVRLEILETEFAVGIELLVEFLDSSPPRDREYEAYERSENGENFFAERFDRPITSPVTEQWFENPDLGAKGKVDLLHSPTRLLDYKTGSRKGASSVVRRSSIDPIHDEPNFQALLYLAHHRRMRPDERLEFVFFHFLDLLDDAVTAEVEFEDALVRITYHPTSFAMYAGSPAAFDALCRGVAESNNRRKTLERLGYEEYARIFETHTMPDTEDREVLLASDFATQLLDRAKMVVGDYKYVEKGVESALKKLLGFRSGAYFEDDVDAFEEFLDEQLDRLNEYRRSEFPVGDPNEDWLDHPDLIRTDDRLEHPDLIRRDE